MHCHICHCAKWPNITKTREKRSYWDLGFRGFSHGPETFPEVVVPGIRGRGKARRPGIAVKERYTHSDPLTQAGLTSSGLLLKTVPPAQHPDKGHFIFKL